MHYFKNLCSLAVFGTLIAATVASPAPAPGADAKGVVSPAPDSASATSPHPGAKKFTLDAQGPTPETAPQFIGVLIMYTSSGCAGGSSETWEIYGYPGGRGCIPVPAGWVTESVTFSQGIGYVSYSSLPPFFQAIGSLPRPSSFVSLTIFFHRFSALG